MKKKAGVFLVNPKLRDELNDRLCAAVLMLKNTDECYEFFEDICTVSELKALGQRLEVARMLDEGATYDAIVERTGASTATLLLPSQSAAKAAGSCLMGGKVL